MSIWNEIFQLAWQNDDYFHILTNVVERLESIASVTDELIATVGELENKLRERMENIAKMESALRVERLATEVYRKSLEGDHLKTLRLRLVRRSIQKPATRPRRDIKPYLVKKAKSNLKKFQAKK